MKKRQSLEDIIAAMEHRAVGYETTESVDEFALVGGELTLVKRKVTTKELPPDVSAAKLIFERGGDESQSMSEEELAAEKKRLILLLKGEEENENYGSGREDKV